MSLERFDKYSVDGGRNYEPVFISVIDINPEFVVSVQHETRYEMSFAIISTSTGGSHYVWDRDGKVSSRLGLVERKSQ